VDVERFAPRDAPAARAGLAGLARRLAEAAGAEGAAAEAAGGGDSFSRDPLEAAAALEAIRPDDRVVVYVGKLIGSKGVELLLAAWPLVLACEPRARLLVVGFGAFRPGLQKLAADLAAGDLAAARATRSETGAELPHLAAFFDALDPDAARAYARATHRLGDTIVWAGRLEHDELADVLPAAEASVVPSTFPEAFGMVAAEAAATGAFPVVARHSGLAEVAHTLAAAVPSEARPWLTFDVGPAAVTQLADALSSWLAAPAELREGTRSGIVDATRERYSWDGVARSVIAAARGELDGLPDP
jgi:glycosyltransferase involved in cell wall biosynthesis